MSTITSLHNPRVKHAVRLRDRRYRAEHGQTLIDGARELGRAIAAGVRVREVFVCEPLCRAEECRELLAALPPPGGEVLSVSEAVFRKLAFGHRAEGVLGVAETPRRGLADLVLPPDPLVAVLEDVEKPGNLGAVLRNADGAGLDAVLVADPRTDLYNPNAIRASLGTLFTIQVCECTGSEAIRWLQERRFTIVAARVNGSVPYTEVDYRGPTAIVLGSEAQGLSALWSGPGVRAACVPMLGAADSLNVSASAAVFFYEARRQRGA